MKVLYKVSNLNFWRYTISRDHLVTEIYHVSWSSWSCDQTWCWNTALDCHSGFSKSHEEIVAAAKNHTAVEEDEDSPHQQCQVEDPKLDMNSKRSRGRWRLATSKVLSWLFRKDTIGSELFLLVRLQVATELTIFTRVTLIVCLPPLLQPQESPPTPSEPPASCAWKRSHTRLWPILTIKVFESS